MADETTPVAIRDGKARLEAEFTLPARAAGLVVFAHGSGSSRRSPRNQAVAAGLRQAGFGTLLLDLLTSEEESLDRVSGRLRFDIGLLAGRLVLVVDWLRDRGHPQPVGLFGASTGAAAALVAAAARAAEVHAVVSRGGRPDLAGSSLRDVRAPTLLVVGGLDPTVLELNRNAAEQLSAPHELVVVPGAGHLFEEPGALDRVTGLARDWFERFLPGGAPDG